MRALCVISGESDRNVRHGSLSNSYSFLFKRQSNVSCRVSKSNDQLPLKRMERRETKKKGVREDSCSTRGRKKNTRARVWLAGALIRIIIIIHTFPLNRLSISLSCLALSSLVLSPHRVPYPPNPHALLRVLHHPSPSLFSYTVSSRALFMLSIDCQTKGWRKTSFFQ